MLCEKCEKETKDTANFCGNCGHQLRKVETVAVRATIDAREPDIQKIPTKPDKVRKNKFREIMSPVELDHIIMSPTVQGIRVAAQSIDIKPNISDFGGSLNHIISPAYSPISRDDFWEVYSFQYFKSGNSAFTFQQLTLDQANRASSQSHTVIIPNDLLNQVDLFKLANLVKSDGQGNKLNSYKDLRDNEVKTLNKLSLDTGDIIFEKPPDNVKLGISDYVKIIGNLYQDQKILFSLNKNNIGSNLSERSDSCKIISFIIFYIMLELDKPISFTTYLPVDQILDRYDLLCTYVTKYSPGESFKTMILDKDKSKFKQETENRITELLKTIQSNEWNYSKSVRGDNEA